MSEAYREQHPLLCDDLSEEEQYGPDYNRRRQGWARNSVKGAASIITRWPDHWLATVTYWWLGLSMIAVVAFIVYNGVMAYALLPPNNNHHTRLRPVEKFGNISNSSLPEVYMHIIANSNNEVNLNKYIPYIEIISEKYCSYSYNLIVILNDTASYTGSLSAEENNELVFKSMWTKEYIHESPKSTKRNLKILYTTLSNYLNDSPLKNNLKLLSENFIEFLVRAISVWNKGGIAVNPEIFTPRSPNSIYIEKLQAILQKYEKPHGNKSYAKIVKMPKLNNKKMFKTEVNNIRDIINILENEDKGYDNNSEDYLTETEDRENIIVTKKERPLRSIKNKEKNDVYAHSVRYNVIEDKINSLPQIKNNEQIEEKQHIKKHYDMHNLKHGHLEKHYSENNVLHFQPMSRDSGGFSLLPLFIDFFFRDRPLVQKTHYHIPVEGTALNLSRQRKSVPSIDNDKLHVTAVENKTETASTTESGINKYRPMITSIKEYIVNNFTTQRQTDVTNEPDDEDFDLTIDINGNIIATRTACHAFVGDLFSDVVHRHSEESLKDFIISELSHFCKGLLSSCRGIDVLLL